MASRKGSCNSRNQSQWADIHLWEICTCLYFPAFSGNLDTNTLWCLWKSKEKCIVTEKHTIKVFEIKNSHSEIYVAVVEYTFEYRQICKYMFTNSGFLFSFWVLQDIWKSKQKCKYVNEMLHILRSILFRIIKTSMSGNWIILKRDVRILLSKSVQ